MRVAMLTAVLAVPALPSVADDAAAGREPGRISVTGEGLVAAEPDMATITLGVTNEHREAQKAMAATSEAVQRILDRMAAMGIEPRDMQTRNLSLLPRWSDRSSGGRSQITGFEASNMVMVRVRDLSALGGILDAVITDGANNFDGLQFSVQDPAPLVSEARKQAVADAMARAGELAEAAGVELGPLIEMSEHGVARPRGMAMEMAAARADSVPVAAGEVSLQANVSMVFAIAD
ncbi:DUF541 domain-containing protein [Pukyongiella litopenaei]|uniref:DUF541 domain-containing protein n=2 Tax=Pukyongiella litopenaei TaxID=2605946 RepID=A0A2S0MUT9_9RHOB|nr:DUF541 domain-containing protein [Pukyongiella litopenaei]